MVTASAASVTPLPLRAYVAQMVRITTEPTASPQSGVLLERQPIVHLTDSLGNPVKIANVPIAAQAVLAGAVDPTATIVASATTALTSGEGVAAFSDVVIKGHIRQNLVLEFYRELNGPDRNIATDSSVVITLRPGIASGIFQLADNERLAAAGLAQPRFEVTDGYNGVPDARVTFAIFQSASSCSLQATAVSSDAMGIATARANMSGTHASCVLRANLEPRQELTAQQLLFLAPVTWAVWRGATNNAWGVGNNWLGGTEPAPDQPVYVPAASAFENSVSGPLTGSRTGSSLVVESGATYAMGSIDELTVTQDLVADGAILGGSRVTLTGTSGTVRGNVSGLLRIGVSQGPCGYSASGIIEANSLELNCALKTESNIRLARDLVTQGMGSLTQNNGNIAVGGNATFSGLTSRLVKGLLEVAGSFVHTRMDDNQLFDASPDHETRFVGNADNLSISWTVAGLTPSRFGRVDIRTTSTSGIALANSDGLATTVVIADLLVRARGVFGIPTLFTIEAGGVTRQGVTVESDGKIVRDPVVSAIINVARTTCNFPLGDIVGLQTCLTP